MLTRWTRPNASAFDALFSFPSDAALEKWASEATLMPASEIHETENVLTLLLDLPGHDAKNIQVRVDGDTLTVKSERTQEKEVGQSGVVRSERRYGVFARSFVLPTVDGSRADARYENGVLKLTLPKKEELKPRSIEVKVQG